MTGAQRKRQERKTMQTEDPTERPARLVTIQTLMVESTKPTDWLIEDIYPQGEAVLMSGANHSGKTYTALDQGLAVAYGARWLGRYPTKQAPVIYVPSEGRTGIGKRLRSSIEWHHPYDSMPPFYLFGDRLNLTTGDTLPHLQEDIEREGALFVIIDVLRDATAGVDENSAEFGDYFGTLRDLAQDTGATVLVLHHLGKDKGKGARGHSSVRDKTDIEVIVKGTPFISGGKIIRTTIGLDAMPPRGKNRNHEPWSLAVDLARPTPELLTPVIVGEYLGGPKPAAETCNDTELQILHALAGYATTCKLPAIESVAVMSIIVEITGKARQQLDKPAKALAEKGYIEIGKAGKAHSYKLTEKGYQETCNTPATPEIADAKPATTHSPPIGAGGLQMGRPTVIDELLALEIQEAEDDEPDDTGPVPEDIAARLGLGR
jgi:hypothetical protein